MYIVLYYLSTLGCQLNYSLSICRIPLVSLSINILAYIQQRDILSKLLPIRNCTYKFASFQIAK